MLYKFFVRHVTDKVAIRLFKQQARQARNQMLERCGIQVHEYADESVTYQVQKPPNDRWMLLKKRVQVRPRNDANSGRLGRLSAAVVYTPAHTSHFAKHRGRLQFGDD